MQMPQFTSSMATSMLRGLHPELAASLLSAPNSISSARVLSPVACSVRLLVITPKRNVCMPGFMAAHRTQREQDMNAWSAQLQAWAIVFAMPSV